MQTIAESVYRCADIGSTIALPKAGTRLENRYVFDSSARLISDEPQPAAGGVPGMPERR
jgi:hypothetical protein